MENTFVIFLYPKDFKAQSDKPLGEVFYTYQEMLDRVVALTKIKAKFSVFKIGECVGDYS